MSFIQVDAVQRQFLNGLLRTEIIKVVQEIRRHKSQHRLHLAADCEFEVQLMENIIQQLEGK